MMLVMAKTRSDLIAGYTKRIEDISSAMDLIANGAQSASITVNGVSKSYTRANLGELRRLRAQLLAELGRIRRGRSFTVTGVRYA